MMVSILLGKVSDYSALQGSYEGTGRIHWQKRGTYRFCCLKVEVYR